MEDGKGPDIIAGTSIGAINAAALASGLTVEQLKQRWLAMHTEEVHRLSSDLPAVTRPLLRFLMRSVLTSDAHGGARESLPAEDRGMSAIGLFSHLSALFHARPFRSLLDTTPWRHTLGQWMDFERINRPHARRCCWPRPSCRAARYGCFATASWPAGRPIRSCSIT